MAATLIARSEPRAVKLGLESRAMESELRQLELAGSARSTTTMGITEYITRLAESTRVSTVTTKC